MKETPIPLAREEQMFIQPFYHSPFIEQFLLLNRKNANDHDIKSTKRQRDRMTIVYICTTMFRENVEEQRKLLKSLQNLANHFNKLPAEQKPRRIYEGHIFFDGGVNGLELGPFALKLVGVLNEVSGQGKNEFSGHLKKYSTPYGLQLEADKSILKGMKLYIHLKDENKVRRKKRWSQVMYMTYISKKHKKHCTTVESGHEVEIDPNNVYILTTDGDVEFEYQSVEHLVGILHRDPNVGAVCGRTHPVGSGPLAWYQIFDYAISHWFQKAAEHVLGSVMCCPGCFSMFRIKALNSVLKTYSSNVKEPKEFLKKDMGEDRWLSTILVEEKWRLEYCAAADNKTHCPTQFKEFFNQRRRWIPSTMANLAQFCSNGFHCCSRRKTVTKRNDSVSMLFILYQAVMLFSSIISPSTVLLIISAGLSVAYNVNATPIAIILLLTCTVYGAVCLWFSEEVQLFVAKLLTFVFVILMGAVIVGIISQTYNSFIEDDNENASPSPALNTTPSSTTPSLEDVPFSAWFVIGLGAAYLAAGLLHPLELSCLLQSLWYLLFLPSGYILLIIYAVCNLHNQSWGTREESKKKKTSMKDRLQIVFRNLFSRCPCWSVELTEKEPPKRSANNKKPRKKQSDVDTHPRLGKYTVIDSCMHGNSVFGTKCFVYSLSTDDPPMYTHSESESGSELQSETESIAISTLLGNAGITVSNSVH